MVKDLHSHLLYGIDDGCKTIEESLSLLKKMSAAGVKDIIITPHYIENSKYVFNNESKEKLFTILKNEVKFEKIDVNLYLGNEVFYTDHFVELIESGEVQTLNNSKYLLFELPMHNHYQGASEVLSELISHGYVPILAHPERYKEFQENPDVAEEFLRMGVLLQGNYTSLFGKYGRGPKKLLKYYIKKGWISFLGSDAHHEFKFNEKSLERKLHWLNKDKDYVYNLLEGNFNKVINNEDIAMIR